VVPGSAFLARSLDVAVSGEGTAWSDTTKVSFGPEITVEKLIVASPTALVARVAVAADAATGPRDVVVSDGASELVYRGGFEVDSPLKVTVAGEAAQGSIFVVHARGLDFATPFDTTQGGSLFTPTYPNVSLAASPGLGATVSSVSEYGVDYQVFVDVDAPTGPLAADIVSGPKEAQTEFPLPAAYAIEARAATPLTPAAPTKFTVTNPGDSALLTYVPTGAQLRIVDIASSTMDLNATPVGYFLPASGKFADCFAIASGATFVSSAVHPYYAVYGDYYAHAGYSVAMTVVETVAQGGAEIEPNDSKNLAASNGAVAPPWVTMAAKLKDDTDEDWYAVTVDAAHVGLSIRAQTGGPDPLTDTVVDIFEQQGNMLIPLGPMGSPSVDSGYLDELTSVATPSVGTYFVKVSASPYFDPAHTVYDVIIRLE
jgi:hypothetical protein